MVVAPFAVPKGQVTPVEVLSFVPPAGLSWASLEPIADPEGVVVADIWALHLDIPEPVFEDPWRVRVVAMLYPDEAAAKHDYDETFLDLTVRQPGAADYKYVEDGSPRFIAGIFGFPPGLELVCWQDGTWNFTITCANRTPKAKFFLNETLLALLGHIRVLDFGV